MVLPGEVSAAQQPAVGVEGLVVRRVPVVVEHDLVRLVLGEVRDAQVGDLRDQRFHLLLPLRVQLVPVLEVVAGTPLEELRALGDLGRIQDRVARDVDVAVDAPVVDAHGRRHGEDPVLPRADALVRRVDAGDVEGRHRQREVHRVPEPEALLVLLASALVEQGVVRIHLLPALAARRSLDLVRARKRSNLRGRGHRHPPPSKGLQRPARGSRHGLAVHAAAGPSCGSLRRRPRGS